MKKIKLSDLIDVESFFRTKSSKTEYEIIKREPKGITLISATVSGRTYRIKSTSVVYQKV